MGNELDDEPVAVPIGLRPSWRKPTLPLQPPRQINASRWQVEEDISLAYDEYGDGHPVVVVHGGPGIPYANQWKGLEPLTDGYQFYYYHQRGCGDSTRPFHRFDGGSFYENMTTLEQTLGLGAQIADIERIRQILGQETIILIGHSYGGFIATLYAAEFPERVSKLILVAPAGVLTRPDNERNLFESARALMSESEQVEYDEVIKEYFDFGSIFSKTDAELVDVHTRVGHFLLPVMGYQLDEFSMTPRSGGWAVFAMYFSAGKTPDYRPALARITAPTLIIQGEDDGISLPGARTYQPIRNSEFITIAREDPDGQAGHLVFNDSPAEFARVVRKFLASQ